MVDETEILVFEISGEANFSGWPIAETKEQKAQAEKNKISDLSRMADDIADDIQREVRKVLMHRFAIQAEVGFSRGSIIVTGTVILISWAGPLITDAVKKELSEIVGVAVRRVMGRVFSDFGIDWEPTGLTVQERSGRRYSSARPTPPVATPRWLSITVAIMAVAVALLVLDRFLTLRPEVLSAIHSTGVGAGATPSSFPSGGGK